MCYWYNGDGRENSSKGKLSRGGIGEEPETECVFSLASGKTEETIINPAAHIFILCMYVDVNALHY